MSGYGRHPCSIRACMAEIPTERRLCYFHVRSEAGYYDGHAHRWGGNRCADCGLTRGRLARKYADAA